MKQIESVLSAQLHRHLGAHLTEQGGARFCVWSPTCETVDVHLVDSGSVIRLTMLGGYHVGVIDQVREGDHYFFRFDGGPDRPDPASRFQPDGVHGPSCVVADSFDWSDHEWKLPARRDLVIYELHIGAFTDEGTFDSAINRLAELADLGVNAIEIMPVADWAGRWNWGYDGVCMFAPSRNYGPPEGLKRLVDAAHQKGLAVILDVVYNHLGPEGNYLGQSGPYLSSEHHTVWGSAPNFDHPDHGTELRRFFAANAVYWLDEFHIDGLRLDAIHCMTDRSDRHVVMEISDTVREWSFESGRSVMLIAESNVYDKTMLIPTADGGCGFDAQWSDDFVHSFFSVVRPGEQLCHRTYRPLADLDQVLRMGYVYAGTLHDQRGRGPLVDRVDTSGLIYNIQNHDFIGNHPLGQRLHQLTSLDTQRAAATLLMLSPAIPMLFMGEEFACDRPFGFFVDFGDAAIRQSVVEGRKREYPQHDWSGGHSPLDESAFYQSKIGPHEAGNQSMRHWYQTLIRVRREWLAMKLIDDNRLSVETDLSTGLFVLRYQGVAGSATVAVRLSDHRGGNDRVEIDCDEPLLLDSRDGSTSNRQLLPNHAKVFATA